MRDELAAEGMEAKHWHGAGPHKKGDGDPTPIDFPVVLRNLSKPENEAIDASRISRAASNFGSKSHQVSIRCDLGYAHVARLLGRRWGADWASWVMASASGRCWVRVRLKGSQR